MSTETSCIRSNLTQTYFLHINVNWPLNCLRWMKAPDLRYCKLAPELPVGHFSKVAPELPEGP